MAAVPSLTPTPALEPLQALPETEAAERLYERHADRVFSYCHRRLRSREEAEDALQTTFLHALRGLRRGVVPNAELAWLLKIAHTVCLTRWETARRCAVEVARDPHVLQDMFAAMPIDRDELIPLRDALDRLTENQRRAILMREWQGLSYREIAAELELSQAAVETLIFRARKALAQGLSGEVKTSARQRALDLCSAVVALRPLLSGSAALKAAATMAVVGATLGTGGALERGPSDRSVPSVVPAQGHADEFVQLGRPSDRAREAPIVDRSRGPGPLRRSSVPASSPAAAAAPGMTGDAGSSPGRGAGGSSTAPGSEPATIHPGSVTEPKQTLENAAERRGGPLADAEGSLVEPVGAPGDPVAGTDSLAAEPEAPEAPDQQTAAEAEAVVPDTPLRSGALVPG